MTRTGRGGGGARAQRTERPTSLPSGSDHEKAVLRAEVRRLVNALSPYGVLSRDSLRREAGALHWHEPLFSRALEAAVAEGQIVELPLGFYGLRR
jgi:hypothetical protein